MRPATTGVDNIRQLREDAYFAPGQAKYRVYIIDETHMLSTGAFNALLKIMEEPPPHVLFILATTEAHKVPATILSRCQRFDFRRIGSEDIAEYLEKISLNEGVVLEHSAGLLIGKLADGGMRDAISLFDLCISHGGAVTAEVVAQAAGMAGSGHLLTLAKAFAQKDTAFALEQIGALHEKSMGYGSVVQRFGSISSGFDDFEDGREAGAIHCSASRGNGRNEAVGPVSDFVPDFIYAFCFAGGAESYVPHCKPAHRAGNVRCPYLQSGDGQLR